MIVAFTGHRPQDLGYGFEPGNKMELEIKKSMRQILVALNATTVISGMAVGVDQYAAEVALEMGLKLVCAIPFRGQEAIWPKPAKERYNNILSKATEVHVVCSGGYEPAKMQVRNIWMVDHCDAVVAYWKGTPGGTGNCVKYATGRKPIHIINPESLVKEG